MIRMDAPQPRVDLAQRQDRWFSTLANVTDAGVLLLGRDQHLEFANRAACELFGFDTLEAFNAGWEGMKPALQTALTRVPDRRGATVSVDVEVPTGGKPRALRLEITCLDEDGCEGYLVVAKDREILAALESDLSLAIHMRGLTRFYLSMAHDLKAPLNAMVLNIELLRTTLGTGGDASPDVRGRQQERYVEVLRQEVMRLNRCLDGLLTQTPPLQGAPQRFDVRELIEELLLLLDPQAKEQRVSVDLHLPAARVMLSGRRVGAIG
jgi:signal transduction histidine kinase